MKPYPLLAAAALALLSGNLLAYTIVESRYHVEVGPDKYIDQLILRCEDGRLITVPWQSKLAESCGEDLMGNVTLPPSKTARPQAKAAEAAPATAPIDDEQKQAMMTQLRSQYGNISEQQVEFLSGPSGTSTRFKPAIVEVLKRYESCRKATKDKTRCATERDNALAKLQEPTPVAAAPAAEEPAASDVAAAEPPARPARHARAKKPPAEPTPAATESAPTAVARVEPVAATPAAAAPVAAAPVAVAPVAVAAPAPPENRAAAEQKIADDYASCMRAKPKFECDQARSKALTALDKPVGKSLKPQRARKQAAVAATPETAMPDAQAAAR